MNPETMIQKMIDELCEMMIEIDNSGITAASYFEIEGEYIKADMALRGLLSILQYKRRDGELR